MQATTSPDPSAAGRSDTELSTPGIRRALQRLLVVAGLTGLAVAQPVLDLLGTNPATFRFNRIGSNGIIVFGLAVVVIPPLLLWLVAEAAGAVAPRMGRILHIATVAVLGGLFGVLLTKALTDAAAVHVVVGVAVAALSAFAVDRVAAFGTWSRLLSLLNPLVLALFVFGSPVSDEIWAGTQEAFAPPIELQQGDEPPPSVIMLVFDEWPTGSLLTPDGTIDESRFPNLAEFADESTFYRHFSAVSPFTQSAVPALVDGLDPFGGPTWADHPNSIFSLLGATHHPIVAETITDLCGLPECGLRPTPPPLPAESSGSIETPPPERAAADVDTGPRWRRLYDTTVEIWTERVLPGTDDSPAAFDDFEVEITTPTPTTVTAGPAARPDPNEGLNEENTELERFFATQVSGQPDRHRLFVEALQPTDVPILGFLHLILPHQPWNLREDGSRYTVAESRETYALDNDHPWPVAVSRQRHLLQAEYTDRLLGDVLRRLEEIDQYDDSIIVVVGDHGVAFEPGEPSRRVTEANLEQIAYAPLFIKTPGQTEGRVDDANLNATDVAPTIADLLGVSLPWETDGSPAGSPAVEARGTAKYIHSFTDAFDYEFLGVVDYDDAEAFPAVLDRVPGPLGPDDARLAGLTRDVAGAELIGSSAEDAFGPSGGSASVDQLAALRDPDPAGPPGEISGRVESAVPGATVLAAVGDRIVGVSELYPRDGEDGHFVVLLPIDALGSADNDIRLARRDPNGDITELTLEER
jgi:hypothetical protein